MFHPSRWDRNRTGAARCLSARVDFRWSDSPDAGVVSVRIGPLDDLRTAPLIQPDQPSRIAVEHCADLVGADIAFEHQADIGAHALDRKHREHLTKIGAHETAFGTDFLHGLRHLHGIQRRLTMHHVHQRRHQTVIALYHAAEIGELEKILGCQTGHWPARMADDDLPQSLILCFPDYLPALGCRKVRGGQTGIAFPDHTDHLTSLRDQLPVAEHGNCQLLSQAEIDASVEALAILEMIARVSGREMDYLSAIPMTQRDPDGA